MILQAEGKLSTSKKSKVYLYYPPLIVVVSPFLSQDMGNVSIQGQIREWLLKPECGHCAKVLEKCYDQRDKIILTGVTPDSKIDFGVHYVSS